MIMRCRLATGQFAFPNAFLTVPPKTIEKPTSTQKIEKTTNSVIDGIDGSKNQKPQESCEGKQISRAAGKKMISSKI